MSSFVRYLFVFGVVLFIVDYFHPFSSTSYTTTAYVQILKQADRMSGRQAYREAQGVLQNAEKTGNLDTKALRKSLEPTLERKQDLQQIFDDLENRRPPNLVLPNPALSNARLLDANGAMALESNNRIGVPLMGGWIRLPKPLYLYGPMKLQVAGFQPVVRDHGESPSVLSNRVTGFDEASDVPVQGGRSFAAYARIHTTEGFTSPVPLQRSTILCPSILGGVGELEFAINNPVVYSNSGRMGFLIAAEPVDPTLCPPEPVAGPLIKTRRDQNLFVGALSSWKPFFFDVSKPFALSATGMMKRGNLVSGPDGILSTKELKELRREYGPVNFIQSDLRYLALIGRFCSLTECGQPFFVGSHRVMCADTRFADHLELTINRQVSHSIHTLGFKLSSVADSGAELGGIPLEGSYTLSVSTEGASCSTT
jgi:hypothetical protein